MTERTTLEELAGIDRYDYIPTARDLDYDETLVLDMSIEGDMTTLHEGPMPGLSRDSALSISTPHAILDVEEWA